VDEERYRAVKWRWIFALGLSLVAAIVVKGEAQQVSGVVLDQVTGTPIRGATVYLLSPDHEILGSVPTDARGRYSLEATEAGEVLLLAEVTGYSTVVSPALILRNDVDTQYEFRIATLIGAAAPAEQIDPETLAQALAVLCESDFDSKTEGILVGVVRDSVSSLPLPEVTTRLEWGDNGRLRSSEVVTGDDGSFVFCEAPAGKSRQLTAEIAGVFTTSEVFDVNPGMLKRKDVFLNLSDSDRPGDVLGRITDFQTGEPVVGAEVKLRGTSFSSMTGTLGSFSFSDVPWGVYFLEIDHIAYQHQSQPLRILGDQAHEVNVALATDAMELEGLSVSVRSRKWFGGMRGFRERKSRGFGYFLDRESIERRGAMKVVDLLREIPGVNVEMARSEVNNPGRTTTSALYFRNCWRYDPSGAQIVTPPMFFLNGIKQLSLDLARGDLDTVRPQDIEAIEVYRGASEVPADFGGSDAGCGVIAIWTKRG
jgi:CarboxypepD_reg-like domain/Carboxypeptidase regulatory-like domain/TonB-dependent Receptor Plug Domain